MSDIPTILSGDYEPDYQQQLNQALREKLANTGWQQPLLTTAERNQVINKNFLPPLKRGTFWFNTDVGAPELIYTVAVAGVSDAVYKTYTIT